jgi:hypothetical protein
MWHYVPLFATSMFDDWNCLLMHCVWKVVSTTKHFWKFESLSLVFQMRLILVSIMNSVWSFMVEILGLIIFILKLRSMPLYQITYILFILINHEVQSCNSSYVIVLLYYILMYEVNCCSTYNEIHYRVYVLQVFLSYIWGWWFSLSSEWLSWWHGWTASGPANVSFFVVKCV